LGACAGSAGGACERADEGLEDEDAPDSPGLVGLAQLATSRPTPISGATIRTDVRFSGEEQFRLATALAIGAVRGCPVGLPLRIDPIPRRPGPAGRCLRRHAVAGGLDGQNLIDAHATLHEGQPAAGVVPPPKPCYLLTLQRHETP
jgi:hypothetical protein